MNVMYIRVSSLDQSTARQIELSKSYNIEKIFEEKISGKNMERPKLMEMLDFVRENDNLYVSELSRLARSTKDLLEITEILEQKKVNLISIKESIDTSTPSGKLMLVLLGAIAEFERETILERQRQGIALAKAEHRYKGGQPKKIDRNLFEALKIEYNNRQINKVEFSKRLGVSRPTLDKLLKESA